MLLIQLKGIKTETGGLWSPVSFEVFVLFFALHLTLIHFIAKMK